MSGCSNSTAVVVEDSMVECAPGNGGVELRVRVAKLESRIVRYRSKYVCAESFYLQKREFILPCSSVNSGGVIKQEGWDVNPIDWVWAKL